MAPAGDRINMNMIKRIGCMLFPFVLSAGIIQAAPCPDSQLELLDDSKTVRTTALLARQEQKASCIFHDDRRLIHNEVEYEVAFVCENGITLYAFWDQFDAVLIDDNGRKGVFMLASFHDDYTCTSSGQKMTKTFVLKRGSQTMKLIDTYFTPFRNR